MQLAPQFNRPFYPGGAHIPQLDAFFRNMAALSEGRIPETEREDMTIGVICQAMGVLADVPPHKARPYVDRMDRAVRYLEREMLQPFADRLYLIPIEPGDIRRGFTAWAEQASVYYKASPAAEQVATAERDFLENINYLEEHSTPGDKKTFKEAGVRWDRAEDALHFLIGRTLGPDTPQEEWQVMSAAAAILFHYGTRVLRKDSRAHDICWRVDDIAASLPYGERMVAQMDTYIDILKNTPPKNESGPAPADV